MFAVFKTGGKQYRVKVGDVATIEKIEGQEGDIVQFNEVLALGGGSKTQVGAPLIEDAGVRARISQQIKGDKVIKFDKRRRKSSSKRTRGHRQLLTVVEIEKILEKDAKKSGIRDAAAPAPAGADVQKIVAKDEKKGAKKPEGAKKPAQAKPESKSAKPAKPAKPAKTPTKKPAKTAAILKAPRGGKADALNKLKGVGAKMVEKLHENGIFHFDQIAEWKSDDIAVMDEKLGAKGKIVSDDWVAQAKAFVSEKE